MDFKKIQNYTLIALLLGISILFFWMVRPYWYPVFWAAVVAALFHPLYLRFVRRFGGRRSLAAGLTEIIIIVLLVLPLLGIIALIIQQAISVYGDIERYLSIIALRQFITAAKEWPWLSRLLEVIDINDVTSRLSAMGSTISKWLYQVVARSGQYTARWLLQLFIMLYTLFYFLRDGDRFLKRLMSLLPLGDRYELLLYRRFVSTAKATLKGTVLIGAIQGLIGGLAFVITGMPAAVFWGMIMVIVAIIPGVGASLILVPTIVIMLILGNWWQAVVLTIALVISGLIDNVLRGPLVGKDIQLHPLLIFFATLGGIIAFGVSGVVIGPIITAFLISIWQIYEEKYKTELERSG